MFFTDMYKTNQFILLMFWCVIQCEKYESDMALMLTNIVGYDGVIA